MMALMKRRLFAILSALSLVLCAVVIALWIGSHGSNHQFLRLSPSKDYHATV